MTDERRDTEPAAEEEQADAGAAPSDMYAPNQQAVRPDGSGPAEEGTGGEPASEPASEEPAAKKAK